MKTFAKWFVLVCGAALCWVALSSAESRPTVPYPEGYRRWVHVKSVLIGPESPFHEQSGGLHHIYANPPAMEGFRAGRFPDGSVIVFDLLEVSTKEGVTSEGRRRHVDVMHKDGTGFAETGGWGFEEFRGDSRTERNVGGRARALCFDCHAGQKKRDFVFSSFRE